MPWVQSNLKISFARETLNVLKACPDLTVSATSHVWRREQQGGSTTCTSDAAPSFLGKLKAFHESLIHFPIPVREQ